jgi:hypothetical protein
MRGATAQGSKLVVVAGDDDGVSLPLSARQRADGSVAGDKSAFSPHSAMRTRLFLSVETAHEQNSVQ